MKKSLYSRLFLLLSIGLAGSGCATLDKDECVTAEWETIGYEDGNRGYPASRIGKHRSACAKHGVTPDLALYTKGRERGLIQYCRASVGYHAGVRGKSYKNVCPAASEADFLKGYRYGRRIYEVNTQVRSLQNQIRSEENYLEELQATIDETESELIRSGITPRRRAALLVELKGLAEKKRDSEAAIAELYSRTDEANFELGRLQERNPYRN
jgi:ribosome modulation factor